MPQPYAASEAWAGGHRGLAPRAPTNSCMDAPTKSGPGHTGKGAGPTAGGYENFHSKETSAPDCLQSIAGAFPCKAVLHKCAVCSHPAEPQSHVQCSCPVLKEARIRAHHNLAQRLWKGIRDASKWWIVTKEQTVTGLQGLPQPKEFIPKWQRAWDELTDLQLVGEGEDMDPSCSLCYCYCCEDCCSRCDLHARYTCGTDSDLGYGCRWPCYVDTCCPHHSHHLYCPYCCSHYHRGCHHCCLGFCHHHCCSCCCC